MKSFLNFLTEAGSTAVQQATRMGLQGDGHGGWYSKEGEFVAKTEKGKLVFYNKRQKVGKQDPPQSDKDKKLSHTTSAKDETPAQVMGQRRKDDDLAGAPNQEQPQDSGGEQPIEMVPPEVEKTKGTLTVAFGRFNPPTIGHEKLLDTVAQSADDNDYIIVPSRSQDKKKNPLDADGKVEVMKQMFPKHSDKIQNDSGTRTIFDVLKKAHNDGYANVRIVGGGDRKKEFDKLANSYNGKMYQFDNIETISAGDRDDDAEDPIEAMSASVQRTHIANGDFDAFYGNMFRPVEVLDKKNKPVEEMQPLMDEKKAKELYLKLRAAMKIEEGWNLWEIAPKFDWKNLRENYVNKKIFNLGETVQNINTGLIGRIIRRGTSYLICVTEDKMMFKSWLKDVTESPKVIKEQKNTEISGVPANQREVGTAAHLKYVQSMVPGSSWGQQFINKYRKKSK